MSWVYKIVAVGLGLLGLGTAAIFLRRRALSQAARLRIHEKMLERQETKNKLEDLKRAEEDTTRVEKAIAARIVELEKAVVAEHKAIDKMSLEEVRDEFVKLGY